MTGTNGYRAGVFAVFQGQTYLAGSWPNDERKITLVHADGSERHVNVDELEEWYRTSWTFAWEGQPFSVLGMDEGMLKGQYKGGSLLFAWDTLDEETSPDGTRQIYTISVEPEHVEHLTEHREDLLTQWKEERQP